KKAEELVDRLSNRVEALRNNATERPAVLITFGESAGTDIGQIHAFGSSCIHTELLEIAGGRNVIESNLPYSILSREAVIRLNPDIIIELAPGGQKPDDPCRAWKTLPDVTAVKNKQVHVLTGDYTCIPGPRFIRTLEDFKQIIGGKR
ncbi:MAG TPA: ABC transporter substrate-binding protein, partial [Pontiella sp.]